jgi:hypothetical protein
MKTVSKQHFANMQKICEVFYERSHKDREYLPEYEAAKAVNDIILKTDVPQQEHFQEIVRLLRAVDDVPHANGSAWFDYKIHTMATLRVNGFYGS